MSHDGTFESEQDPLFRHGQDRPTSPPTHPELPSWAGKSEPRISTAYAELGGGVFDDYDPDNLDSVGEQKPVSPREKARRLARDAFNAHRESQGKPPIPYGTPLPDAIARQLARPLRRRR